ncbi:glycosyltransferase family 8 protein [Cronobacter turicensis]|uniref:glycosyltransferase family 8 protein n=1 Tax=Cronobacter turicensis TaxID=413502 RepID=UPI0011ACC3B0|nr:glycosyltransferase family 8 protein [Cronobacter turicensis]NHV07962.1 glycosyltransferase family 8 protein [Cronobacter turicensis]NHV63151.1 glycosyltransferase family 8 protein [Cronobacter turicensis]NHW10092.1 glycosyltransferase family 8 protein [Cronobacter turicensis]TWR32627.1 glycosyltransferase family 8 protein [Cronobacter turicensis]
METIQIATGVSRNFYDPLSVMLTSLLENNQAHHLNFHVLHSDFTNEDIEKFNLLFTKYNNLSLNFVELDESKLAGLPLLQHFKISTYFRILAPSVLSAYDKVLYLDADIIVDGDILELWQTDVTDYTLAAVREESIVALDKRLKMPADYKYFNAGVVVLNAKKIRDESKFDPVVAYLKENINEILYLDQDALNAVLYDEWLEIDEKWNYHNTFILKKKNNAEHIFLDRPIIIHYTGPVKPWDAESAHIFKERYWHYQRILTGNVQESKAGLNLQSAAARKVIKKVYHLVLSNKYSRKLIFKLNTVLKEHPYTTKHYFKLKERLAPAPQIMSSFQAKHAQIELPFLESSLDFTFFNIREFANYIQLDGYVFKKDFSNRNTKNYLLLRKTTDFNQKYIFKLNSLDHVWINDIYDDGNDYSKSGFFNFIGKRDLDKGKYEIGLIVQNNDDIHYKMTNITVIV